MVSVMVADINVIIAKGAKQLNIDLPPEAGAAFRAYYDFLENHGRKINLTTISGAEDVAQLHFLDSLALLKTAAVFKSANVIDIGSGAGLPGIPLKIAEPSLKLTLLEATGKKVSFLSELCSELGIEASCKNVRAEEAAHTPEMRGQYDFAVARAVARLNILCELCLPFVRIGGLFIAMKGIDSDDEVDEAKSAINLLGGELQELFEYTLPCTAITRRAALIEKTTETQRTFPRRFAKIQKSPL